MPPGGSPPGGCPEGGTSPDPGLLPPAGSLPSAPFPGAVVPFVDDMGGNGLDGTAGSPGG